MTDVANAADGENASAPAAAKAAPKDPWALPDVSHLVVGVLGGTGNQGRGLAYRSGCYVRFHASRLPRGMAML